MWALSPQYVFGAAGLLVAGVTRPPRYATAPYEPSMSRAAAIMLRDWARDVRKVWEVVVYVGRYGKQPIDHVERWPISKVLRVARGISTLLEAEAKASRA